MFQKYFRSAFFIKLFNWEYWPFDVLYGPLYFYWIWMSIKTRAPFFINASNPLIKNGGFVLESKKEIYNLIPHQYYPATLLFQSGVSKKLLFGTLDASTITFPLIAKPDIGMRGIAVEKIDSREALLLYAEKSAVAFLVQDFVSFEREVGIFYVRMPNESKGKITGIVGKEFLTVIGDGKSTVLDLLKKDQRYILQIPFFQKNDPATLDMVLVDQEEKLLVPYGNHARGAKFIDISHLNSSKLTDSIDRICKQIPDFYFGRLDIRYDNWEALCNGEKLSIIELNGAGSEPTHIYDPSHSIFFAWKEIIRHWNLLQKVSIINHHNLRIPYMDIKTGLRMLKENNAYTKKLTSIKSDKNTETNIKKYSIIKERINSFMYN